MKTFSLFKRRILTINSLFVLFCLLTFQQYEETDAVSCTGCPASSPYGKKGATACYATLADCTAALGSGCVLCQ